MRKWIKKNCKIILFVSICALIVIGPFVINLLFKLHTSTDLLVAEWNASAALSYYGTIIAAVIAIYGIFITIQYSQVSYKEDVRNRSIPFIVIEMLKTNVHKSNFGLNDSQFDVNITEGYQEYKLTDCYCILNNGKIEFRSSLTKPQKDLLDNAGMKYDTCEDLLRLCAIDYICVPFEIENVGNGSAIRMRYGINRKETNLEDREYLPTFSLKPFTPIMLHIFSEDCSVDSLNLGAYILSFYYEDIYSNSYEQHFDITIEYDKERNVPVFSIDMDHSQIFLGDKKNG